MAIYYVEATGSNIYPFSSRETAAISFYNLFDELSNHHIYELTSDDIVYVHGLIIEPNEWGWYTVCDASILGTNSLIDKINLSTGCFYSSTKGGTFKNLEIFTDEPDAEENWLIYNPAIVEHCRFNGKNIAECAIFQNEPQNISFIGNTFEGFTGDAIYIDFIGNVGDFVNLNQFAPPPWTWQGMTSDINGNIWCVVNGETGPIYVQHGGVGDFVYYGYSVPWARDIAVASNGDIYVVTDENFNGAIYKQTGGSGSFVNIFSVSGVSWAGITIALNGDIYAISGCVHIPNLNQGIYKSTGGGPFTSLGEPDRYWAGITASPNGDIYAVAGTSVYRQVGGIGSFGLYTTLSGSGQDMASDSEGNIYAIAGGGIYKKLAGSSSFISMSAPWGNWRGLTVASNFDIYASQIGGGSIYKRPFNYEGPFYNITVSGNSIKSTEYIGVDILLNKASIDFLNFFNNAIITNESEGTTLVKYTNSIVNNFDHSNNVMTIDFVYSGNELVINPHETEVVGDPGFTNIEPNPMMINESSICYHAGKTSLIVTDIIGTVFNDPPSIGAYEVPILLQADFVGDPNSGKANLTVQFTDLSLGEPISWDWDFGDGSPHSYEQNPIHTYTVSGTYTVSLIIKNEAQQSHAISKIDYITVEMNANFHANVLQGPSSLIVNFFDDSLGEPTNWDWDFGDGSPHSYEQNPLHTYEQSNKYTVTLIASNINSSDIVIKTNYITVYIVADFIADPTQGISTLNTQFVDLSKGGSQTWYWNFGDGEYSNVRNPVHFYKSPGKYTVSLTVTNFIGTSSITKENYILINAISTLDVAPDPDVKAYLFGNGSAQKKIVGIKIINNQQ